MNGVGSIGCLAGLIITVRGDLPAGTVIVWSLAVTAIIFAWLVWRMIRHIDNNAENNIA